MFHKKYKQINSTWIYYHSGPSAINCWILLPVAHHRDSNAYFGYGMATLILELRQKYPSISVSVELIAFNSQRL